MTDQTRQPIPFSEEPDYFEAALASGYAADFRTGAEGAYAKGDRWAKYWRSSKLDVLVSQLQEGIFGVYAYPPAGFVIDDTSHIEKREIFRGWILQYVAVPHGWRTLAASQEVGICEFVRLRGKYKAG